VQLAKDRENARRAKDWKKSDELRDGSLRAVGKFAIQKTAKNSRRAARRDLGSACVSRADCGVSAQRTFLQFGYQNSFGNREKVAMAGHHRQQSETRALPDEDARLPEPKRLNLRSQNASCSGHLET